ncbi:hypothetical protein [Caulobacter segnis]|uniref:hypothetical protein n=1 Tax=Caulobacter segnis TaxID=88688 RepID=UPI002864CD35|nr:hypothetical protein [Caulobacter segnis]MDR6625705.1 hypothetical protein [Caulobacter segnis]
MTIIESIPDGTTHIGIDYQNLIPISQLSKSDRIETLIGSSHVIVSSPNHGQRHIALSEPANKSDLSKTYSQRKDDIEKKSSAFREATTKTIRDLRAKITNLRMMKFNEVIRENTSEIDELFDLFGESAELARFLVLEGHLDDTYYQYISLFHSGRLSPSDNKFLIRIRGFNNPDPDFQIDNPKEVIEAMRDEDFSRNYVLNVTIVDYLLTANAQYSDKIARLYDFIANNFEQCETFLAAYYARGVAVSTLIIRLAKAWPGFIEAALASPNSSMHVARMLSHLIGMQLQGLADKHPALSDFVSKALPDVLSAGVDFPPDRLKALKIEVPDLSALEAHPGVLNVLFNEGLYGLSIENLDFIFRSTLGIDTDTRAHQQNYTLVLEVDNAPLVAKIDRDFAGYVEDVLLRLPDNRFEGVPAILRVLERDDLDLDSLVKFISKQAASLPTLEGIPLRLHAALFANERIEPTWENCLSFLGSEVSDREILTRFLNKAGTVAALEESAIPDGEAARSLRSFVIENDGLSDRAYSAYVRALPRNFKEFPEALSANKTKILVDMNRINFSASNLDHLREDLTLSVKFVQNNINRFFEIETECDVDDEFREKLLETNIDDQSKLRIIRSMDLGSLETSPSRAEVIGRVMARTGVTPDELSVESARAVIVNSSSTNDQIVLFNMLHKKFDNQQVHDILQMLPAPMRDIKPGWGVPRLKFNKANLAFVSWLKDREIISSWRQDAFLSDDIRINLFRK